MENCQHITIAICDDNEKDQKKLQDMLHTLLNNEARTVKCIVTVYRSADELLGALAKNEYMDIYFLDIELDHRQNGLLIASQIHSVHPGAIILFYSAHDRYAPQGYKTGAIRFLRKEYLKEELPEALDYALQQCAGKRRFLLLTDRTNVLHRIAYDSIVYVKTEGRFLTVHLNPELCLTSAIGIRKLYADLNDSRYAFIDKGTFVNLGYIKSVGDHALRLLNDVALPISRRNYTGVRSAFSKYIREV